MPRKKKTNLIQRGETREHRRWRVEIRGRTEANEVKKRNGCFERERESGSCGTS
jgi:post-segregation antitoxin (ccd killing protein)